LSEGFPKSNLKVGTQVKKESSPPPPIKK